MTRERLEARIAEVEAAIARAAERAGRDPAAVEILPVTKGHATDMIRRVAHVGLGMIGENRVDEARRKREALGGKLGLRWHMIGHVQRNKANRALETFDVIESVDSVRLARRLSGLLSGRDRELEVLVQVNSSGEVTKGGLPADEAMDAVREICRLPGLRVTGLMTMAPFTADETLLRETFRTLRRLFERCADQVDAFEPCVLSMGMSNDFKIAVEEGSTRVRLGTTLLGERPGQ